MVQVMAQISEKYPAVSANLVTVEVVQNPSSNSYVVVSQDPESEEIVTIDVIFDKETEVMDWVDVQETPESEILYVNPIPKPEVIYQTKEEIKESTVIQNIVEKVETQIPHKIKEVVYVKETKSSMTTTFEMAVVNSDGKNEMVVVLVDNQDPTDCSVIDVVPEVTEVTPAVLPIVPTQTTITVDSTSSTTTTTNNQ